MDRLEARRVFTRIVELGSFTRAASDLRLPRATVTLAVQGLEARLGTRLLHLTTRQVNATPEGQHFYERCRRALLKVEDAQAGRQARRQGAGAHCGEHGGARRHPGAAGFPQGSREL